MNLEPGPMPGDMMAAVQEAADHADDFDATVRLYWPRIFRFVLASIRDREAAENLTQDCFWKAYQARHRFRGDCSMHTWLAQIAVNLIRDYARNRRLQFWKRAESGGIDSAAAGEWLSGSEVSPEMRASAREELQAVWQATRELPERQRTVFLLRFVEDMEILEIAAATGLREGTVKAHLFRALQTIREKSRRTK